MRNNSLPQGWFECGPGRSLGGLELFIPIDLNPFRMEEFTKSHVTIFRFHVRAFDKLISFTIFIVC